jgi:cysteine desulfurase family protein (TIGR01976 family)
VARDRGCEVRWLDFDVEDCTLQMDHLGELLSPRTRLVAVGYASNAVGTINPVADIIRLAKRVGAMTYIDAVHYAPHGPIDVQELGCDFLVVSAYKFFGPHLGILYGKLEHLKQLQSYKVRPAPGEPPGKFETGTNNFEGIAGLLGAFDYLLDLSDLLTNEGQPRRGESSSGNRPRFLQTMTAIRTKEMEAAEYLIRALKALPGVHIWGITEPDHFDERVPTVSFTLRGHHPRQVAEHLGRSGIHVWDGNYYALEVTERLGLEEGGGMVRVGLMHYNTRAEIDTFISQLAELTD